MQKQNFDQMSEKAKPFLYFYLTVVTMFLLQMAV